MHSVDPERVFRAVDMCLGFHSEQHDTIVRDQMRARQILAQGTRSVLINIRQPYGHALYRRRTGWNRWCRFDDKLQNMAHAMFLLDYFLFDFD